MMWKCELAGLDDSFGHCQSEATVADSRARWSCQVQVSEPSFYVVIPIEEKL